MKITVLIMVLLMLISLVQAGEVLLDENHDLIAPDFIASFYDYYSVNLLNTRMLGMGATTVSIQGGIENALVNPAAFRGGLYKLNIEGLVKSSVKEMNSYASTEDPDVVVEKQNLESGIPSGFVGIGFSPAPYLSLGTSISIPQTIRYNLLGRALPTGAFVDRFPSMQNYQTTLTLTGHYEQLSFGLNVIYNYYVFRDLRLIAPHFDRIRFEEGVWRLQPGLLYNMEKFFFGASYKFATEQEIEMGNTEPYYHIYNTHFPALLETGVSFQYSDDITIALALEFEQTSKQYEGFDDRLKLKLGVEKQFDNYDIRGGLISIPGIYTGPFAIPEDTITEGDFIFDPLPYDYGIVGKTDQLLLTLGFTYYTRDIDLSMAMAKDVLQNLDLFQVGFSVNIKLGEIANRGQQGL